jgi:hypothetical protein
MLSRSVCYLFILFLEPPEFHGLQLDFLSSALPHLACRLLRATYPPPRTIYHNDGHHFFFFSATGSVSAAAGP